MGKEYGKCYEFAGGGSSAGSMTCDVCSGQINNKTEDWMHAQKTIDKWGDWKYVCRHRSCVGNDYGWRREEKAKKDYRDKVLSLASELEKYRDQGGDMNSIFYGALQEIGIDT